MIDFNVVRHFDDACKVLIDKRMVPLPEGVSAQEILRLLREHERRHVCLNNVCDQIERFERANRKNQDKRKIFQLIAAAAQLYVLAVLEHRRQMLLSVAEAKRLASEGNLRKEMAQITREATHVEEFKEGTPKQAG